MKLTEKQKNCKYCQNEDPDDNLAICGQSGVDGEHWAIDKNIFERTYKRVD